MRVWLIPLMGLTIVLAAAACAADDTTLLPDGAEGVLTGSVTIGPLCPVGPCAGLPGDVYASRELHLRQQDNEPIGIQLEPDGSFSAVIPTGSYIV